MSTKIHLTPELGPRPMNSQIYAGKKININQFTRINNQPVSLNPEDTALLSNIHNIINIESSTSSLVTDTDLQLKTDENLLDVTPVHHYSADDNPNSNPLLKSKDVLTFHSDFINNVTREDLLTYKSMMKREIYEKRFHEKQRLEKQKATAELKQTEQLLYDPSVKSDTTTNSPKYKPNYKRPIILENRLKDYLLHLYSPRRLHFTDDAYKELESIMLIVMEKIMITVPEFMHTRTKRIIYSDIISAEKKLKLTHLKSQ